MPGVARPTWILADPHGGADAGADAALLSLLERALEARAELLILGDLFYAWLAPERFWTEGQRQVLQRLRTLRARGGRVSLVVGNRDYLADVLVGDVFDAVHEGEQVLPIGGRPTLVAHGDLANPEDLAYRTWHQLSRTPAARALLLSLPGALGRAMAQRLEARLARTNARYKTGVLPMRALEALGRRALALGAERALLGHFHHDRTVAVPQGAPVVIAPAWLDHRRLLLAGADGALRSVSPPDLVG